MRKGGPTPQVSLLVGLTCLLVLGVGCTSSRSGGKAARTDWSQPDPDSPQERVIYVPAAPSSAAVASTAGWSQPREAAPVAPSPHQPAPAAPAAPAAPVATPRDAAPAHPSPPPTTAAPALPPAIIDDNHQPYRPPADQEAFQIVPAARADAHYTVQKGDTLMSIARKHYGDDSAWTRIFQANRDILQDASAIKPGMTLKMP